jgi:hypothetical protein
MAINTWFNVQKWVDHDWVDRSPDGSDWYSTFDNAKYFCDSYTTRSTSAIVTTTAARCAV